MSKVILLDNITTLDIPVDRILEQAIGKLNGAVIMGFDKDDEFYAVSSYADGGTVLWLMALLKQELMNNKDH